MSFWLARRNASDGLEHHRKELEEPRQAPVSLEDAATDYLARIQPGGDLHSFLELGQLAHAEERVFYSHSGVTDENARVVPEHATRFDDARAWATALNAWGRAELRKVTDAFASAGLGEHVPATLVCYGASVRDAAGVSRDNPNNVVYGPRLQEGDNHRAPSRRVVDFFAKAGIATEAVGHRPFGDLPGPCGKARVHDATSDGATIAYSVGPRSRPPIGYVTADGFTIAGRTRAHGRTRYLLYRYAEKFRLEQQIVSRTELSKRSPRPAGIDIASAQI